MKNKIRIALIDDHQLFLDGLTTLLQQEKDFEIIYTSTKATDFVVQLKDLAVDILIVDISMPEMNGLELINEIKQQEFLLKIIVLSSYANSIDSSFVDAALLKEISEKELFTTIRTVYNDTYKQKVNMQNFNVIHSSFLSKREKQIINLIGEGLTVNEIANKIVLSKHTIETHKKNIFFKLGVINNAQLIKKSMVLGIIDV
ncbi:DNA-binding response regulator [Empedobacter brevis NBRC 14943 = ATCC 43319]|uniref:DNA-binding response regulator n=1 Tax=Empedobacter brevis NBRC 14943 = ATCC 43319 TaxID=1218108 RepID=A0A511NKX8_9FLAO|nr:response regulator transcription factor [Empedobacter brevis]GEM53444.1 DNA-binding response regulator [Empedobacter brevis NBRC 14943 = ATCC 43319]